MSTGLLSSHTGLHRKAQSSNERKVLGCPHVTVAGTNELLRRTLPLGFNLNLILIHLHFNLIVIDS